MQAANFIKSKASNKDDEVQKVRTHRSFAKPVLVASITQDRCSNATYIEEKKDGLGWITTRVKLAKGKNVWNKDVRRPERRRKPVRNKVGDEFTEKSAENIFAKSHKQTGGVNIVIYVGFIMVTLGMILTFIGAGERGFKTPELKLIGPSLIACGILFCILRILFCTFNCKNKDKPPDKLSLISPSTEVISSSEDPSTVPLEPLVSKQTPTTNSLPIKRIEVRSSHTRDEIKESQIDTEEEGDDDVDLGISWDPYDSKYTQSQSSRRSSCSQESQIPKLPEIRQNNNEIILDPKQLSANLQ